MCNCLKLVLNESIYLLDFCLVQQAVLECAPHRWYAIGSKLGYSEGQIESMVKGIALDVDKLMKIINHMRMVEDKDSGVANRLLRACEAIPDPVIAAVQDKVQQLRSNMQ